MTRSDRRAVALVVGLIAIVWLLAHVPAAQSYVTPTWTVPPSAVAAIGVGSPAPVLELQPSPSASGNLPPSGSISDLVSVGTASWYDNGAGYYAALPGPWRAARTRRSAI
jgi:hypothetical protein